MDNEDVNLNIAKDLYATAKQLDPSRPVNTADGIWGATAPMPNPQDFRRYISSYGHVWADLCRHVLWCHLG